MHLTEAAIRLRKQGIELLFSTFIAFPAPNVVP